MALNVKKVSQLNEVSYSTVDGSALFYFVTNTGDKSYNIRLSNLFLATNNLSTFKFASDTLSVSEGALNASGTFNLSGALNTGNTAITGTLNVSGTSTLHALNTGNTAITGTLNVSGTSTLHALNTGNTAITGTLNVSSDASITGNVTANSIVKSGGTSSQFLKADGSVDTSTYLTSSLGVGQCWQDVTSSRVSGATYTNNTSNPIFVFVTHDDTGGSTARVSVVVDGITICNNALYDSGGSVGAFTTSFIVVSGGTYKVTNTANTINKWVELR